METNSCPRCHHVREPNSPAPAWQCPSCGVAYAKAQARAEQTNLSTYFAAHARASSAERTAAARHSFFATISGRLLLTAVILLLFFDGKAWLQASPSPRSDPGEPTAAVEIYTTSFCGTCKIAKAYMQRQGIAYTEHDIESDIERRREFYARGGTATPLIFVHGQRMQGFDVKEFEPLRRGKT
jgi:glutaredoxin